VRHDSYFLIAARDERNVTLASNDLGKGARLHGVERGVGRYWRLIPAGASSSTEHSNNETCELPGWHQTSFIRSASKELLGELERHRPE
jgi:hypothetical protein